MGDVVKTRNSEPLVDIRCPSAEGSVLAIKGTTVSVGVVGRAEVSLSAAVVTSRYASEIVMDATISVTALIMPSEIVPADVLPVDDPSICKAVIAAS